MPPAHQPSQLSSFSPAAATSRQLRIGVLLPRYVLLCALFVLVLPGRFAAAKSHHLKVESSNAGETTEQRQEQQRLLDLQLAENELGEEDEAREESMGGSGKGDLFRKYLSRGIIGCTTKYVSILQKLNKLIADAHAEYTQCQQLMKEADSDRKSKKFAAQLEMINELFD